MINATPPIWRRNDIQCDSPELTSVDTECAQNVPSQSLDRQRICASRRSSDIGCSSTTLVSSDAKINRRIANRRRRKWTRVIAGLAILVCLGGYAAAIFAYFAAGATTKCEDFKGKFDVALAANAVAAVYVLFVLAVVGRVLTWYVGGICQLRKIDGLQGPRLVRRQRQRNVATLRRATSNCALIRCGGDRVGEIIDHFGFDRHWVFREVASRCL
jgi:hypothetical protein